MPSKRPTADLLRILRRPRVLRPRVRERGESSRPTDKKADIAYLTPTVHISQQYITITLDIGKCFDRECQRGTLYLEPEKSK